MKFIDYYLFGQSPFTLFGHRALRELADRQAVGIRIKPIHLQALWENSGAEPTPQQKPVRQRYELIDFQRVALERGLKINLQPAHFPIDIALADRCAIAIEESGGDAFDYVEAVGRGVWCDEADMSTEAAVAERLQATGHDPLTILEQARGDAVEAIRSANTRDAIAADAVGVPAYVWNGEVFFGQDRLSALESAIKSGRPPFLATANS